VEDPIDKTRGEKKGTKKVSSCMGWGGKKNSKKKKGHVNERVGNRFSYISSNIPLEGKIV